MSAKIEQDVKAEKGNGRFDQCLGKHVSLMEREWSYY